MRIGSGLMGSDLSALYSLNRAFTDMKTAGVRLATMQRINAASDDPAGLIAAQQQVNESIHQNLAEAYSEIMDTDVAQEASNMIRAQILADAGIATILLGNQRRESVGAIVGLAGQNNRGVGWP